VSRKEEKSKQKRSEFGEMDITSAFQAEFVGSSPIIRKMNNVFRGVIKHVRWEMAFDTAISQSERSEKRLEMDDWIPYMRKHTSKSNEPSGIETS
jgi:hypothetical protein